MLLNKKEAAALAGISRKTLYAHIESKPISVTKDPYDENSEKIELSELERVYGVECISKNRKAIEDKKAETQSVTQTDSPISHDVTPSHTEVRVREQAKEIELKEKAYEQRVSDLEDILNEVKDKASTYQRLLEDRTGEPKDGAGDVDSKMAALEDRLAKQIAANDRAAEERILKARRTAKKMIDDERAKAAAAKEASEKELERERNKGLFQKLFKKAG